MDFFTSEEIVASLGDKAEMKGKLSFVRLCILGIMAGFCIALGYLAFIRITGTAPTEWEVLIIFWAVLYFQLD